MISTTLLITLGKVAGGLTALYIFYTTVLKKWIKSAYARLMEDLSKQVGEINLKLDVMGKEIGFLSTAQKVAFNESGTMWWRADKDGLTIEISEATCEFLMLTPERLMGSNWLNQVPSEEHAGIEMAYRDSVKFKRDFDVIITFIKGNRERVQLHARAKYGNEDWFGIHKVA